MAARSPAGHHGDTEPTGPILRLRGGGGTSHYQLMHWWAWPLPPSGPLEFICQLGTGETRVGIDAQLILDAAQRSAVSEYGHRTKADHHPLA
jgi:hypothetical protein